jgi:uncharacterized protein (DUF952 family)
MSDKEIKVTDGAGVPKNLFHLVPEELFSRYLDESGNYDCRNRQEWGKDSDFIHTTTTRKDLKEKVADVNWKNYPKEMGFVLLKINSGKIGSYLTYAEYDGTIYYHIWGNLPADSFEVIEVTRNDDGTFDI